MTNYNLVNSAKSVNEEDFVEIEREINIHFPVDLKMFYLKNNGGNVEGGKSIFLDKEGNDYSIK